VFGNIVGCLYAAGEASLCMVVEYARYGNLRDFLQRNKPVTVDFPLASTTNSISTSSSSSSSSNSGGGGGGSGSSACAKCLAEWAAASPCHRTPLTTHHLLSFARQAAQGMQFLASSKVRFTTTITYLHCRKPV